MLLDPSFQEVLSFINVGGIISYTDKLINNNGPKKDLRNLIFPAEKFSKNLFRAPFL